MRRSIDRDEILEALLTCLGFVDALQSEGHDVGEMRKLIQRAINARKMEWEEPVSGGVND